MQGERKRVTTGLTSIGSRLAAGLLLVLPLGSGTAIAATPSGAPPSNSYEECLLDGLANVSDEITVGELKRRCRQQPGTIVPKSAVVKRLEEEKQAEELSFVITPHHPNYIIAAYNTSDPNMGPFQEAFPGEEFSFQDTELKFQLSLKFLLWNDMFGSSADLYAAYTNRSFWQAFNKDISSPFRETNHEPEAWVQFDTDWNLLGLTNRVVAVGINHQSNGRAGPLSRSWNRVFADFVFERDDFYFSVKPWWRIPESRSDDDNPDITDYLGNFEFQGVYKLGRHNFGLMVRNNLDSDNKGAIQLDWSFPLIQRLRGYVQWFNGYGESMIDYDHYVNSIGIGVQLSDRL